MGSDLIPEGTNKAVNRYNITGVKEFAKEMNDKGLGKPKVSLQFELSSSGVTRLVKAEAAVEETYTDDEEGDENATDATKEEKDDDKSESETSEEETNDKASSENKTDENTTEKASEDVKDEKKKKKKKKTIKVE